MADQTTSNSIDANQAIALANLRQQLAEKLIRYSFVLIGIVVVVVIGMAILAASSAYYFRSIEWVEPLQQATDKVMTAVLPLLGAWVGAIIAFYFGRENYEAASLTARQVLQATQPDKLASIAARDAMVPVASLVVVATPAEAATPMMDILKRFETRGLGRLIFTSEAKAATPGSAGPNAVATGVLHDSTVKSFVLDHVNATTLPAAVTLKMLTDDPGIQKLLSSAIVYVAPETTLAEVRRKMDEASKSASASVRDAFVTKTGDKSEPLLGYITDIDLAEKGALK
jgi:hypothetical protein